MPFKNPLVAGVELVRDAIQSANYVTGVSGWRISRNGIAEFMQAIISASGLLIEGTDGSYFHAYQFGTSVTSEYKGPDFVGHVITPAIVQAETDPVTGTPSLYIQSPQFDAGELAFIYMEGGDLGGPASQINAGANGFAVNVYEPTGDPAYSGAISATDTAVALIHSGEIYLEGTSLGTYITAPVTEDGNKLIAVQGRTILTAASTRYNATAEAIITDATITVALTAGITYRLMVRSPWTSANAGQTARFQVRRTDLAGPIVDYAQATIGGAGFTERIFFWVEYTPAADGNVTFVLTCQNAAGGANIVVTTGAAAFLSMVVERIS